MFNMTLLLFVITFLAISSVYSGRSRKITGGKDTDITKYPYQVQVLEVAQWKHRSTYPICGGAIIGRKVVITAGHCTFPVHHKPEMLYIRAGTSYRSGKYASTHRATEIKIHELYQKRYASENDISLVFVDPPFVIDETRQAIPIAFTRAIDGDVAIVTGWGLTDSKATVFPIKLQSTELEIMTAETCNEHTEWSGQIDIAGTLCAISDKGRSACNGDSGGPLVVNGRLVGIVAWGPDERCGALGYPTVFTNVTYYAPWIMAQMLETNLTYVV